MNYQRKIFITGAQYGLGKSILNLSVDKGIETYFHFHKNPNNLEIPYGDINDSEVRKNILNYVRQKDINVFINNVGIYHTKKILELNENEIIETISTNLTSTILLTKSILNFFVGRGYGMIYNINSLAGLYGSKNESVYCASKFGLKGFTESVKEEMKEYENIKLVNVILGAMKTKMTKHRLNYDLLLDPNEVADCILNHIMQNYMNIDNELIIKRQNYI
jgi:short-subunit dehydrogenase